MSPLRYSIIISNYNYGRYIKLAVDGALAQTLPAHEIIVVDDGSTDESLEVLKAFRDNAKVIVVTQKNSGQCFALAAGLEKASGDICCTLDADDAYTPDYLAEIDKVYASKPEIDFIFTQLKGMGIRAEEDHPLPSAWLNPGRDYDYGFTAIIACFCTGARFIGNLTSALSFRRKVAQHFYFREIMASSHFPMNGCGADACMVLSASLFGYRKYYIHQKLVNYRVHEASISHTKRSRVNQAIFEYSHLVMAEKVLAFYKAKSGLGPELRAALLKEFRTVPEPNAAHAALYEAEIEKAERDSAMRKGFLKRAEHGLRQLRRRLSGKKRLQP